MRQRLKEYYFDTIIPQLMSTSKLNYKNKHQVPRIQKIVLNRGLGDASQNEQILKSSRRILNLCNLNILLIIHFLSKSIKLIS